MIQPNDEAERTLWCGNLHDKVTEELLYELFLQAGPLEKVTVIGDKRYGPKYAFIKFKHSVSVPYTLQLMNGIRLYDQPLRLKERSGSGNAGLAEAAPAQQSMGPPPPLMPQSLRVPRPSIVAMHSANLVPFNNSSSGGHAGLLRSSSEPEGLGTNWHESRRTGNMAHVRERSAGQYSRPQVHQRPIQGILAQNIASQLYTLRNARVDARASHSNHHRQQNHHKQFDDHGGFRRR